MYRVLTVTAQGGDPATLWARRLRPDPSLTVPKRWS